MKKLETYVVKAADAADKTTYHDDAFSYLDSPHNLAIFAGGTGVANMNTTISGKTYPKYNYEEMSGSLEEQKLTSSKDKRYIYLTGDVTYNIPTKEKSGAIWCESGDHVIDFNGHKIDRNTGSSAVVSGTTIYVGAKAYVDGEIK